MAWKSTAKPGCVVVLLQVHFWCVFSCSDPPPCPRHLPPSHPTSPTPPQPAVQQQPVPGLPQEPLPRLLCAWAECVAVHRRPPADPPHQGATGGGVQRGSTGEGVWGAYWLQLQLARAIAVKLGYMHLVRRRGGWCRRVLSEGSRHCWRSTAWQHGGVHGCGFAAGFWSLTGIVRKQGSRPLCPRGIGCCGVR